ncbi:hypothetical protein DSO57_1001712 [Entomophthora muscae]|uniref:Uncharacterized protein n=1 Tax=Entomophthora muscae TaxID=34485 RepID=A0ACC2SLJ6_9FUNG|nr:hypothetical protein DSO57_1001712 [Entomophthora muscae]
MVTRLIIEEESDNADHNFSDIIKKFPALEKFDYTICGLPGYKINSFRYDVENMVFKKIGLSEGGEETFEGLHFQDDIPSKTPLFSSDEEVTHELQFKLLMNANTDSLIDFIHQFAYLDVIHLKPGSLDQEELAELLLS